MKIVFAPNEVLSAPAKPVEKINSQVLKTIEQMKIALNSAKDPEGVGLAAPQIGVPLQIFIAKPNPAGKIMTFINPKIVEIEGLLQSFTRKRKVGADERSEGARLRAKRDKGGRKKKEVQKLEGCLSLKDIWGTVLRSPQVKVSFLDEKGQQQTKVFKDFLATIDQHKYDHLQGILFPKRVLEQKGKLYKSSKDEKGEDLFEEIEL